MTNSKYQKLKQRSLKRSMGIDDFSQLASTPAPKPLMGGLAIILGVVAYRLILLHRDPETFRIWMCGDGLVEWVTFADPLRNS